MNGCGGRDKEREREREMPLLGCRTTSWYICSTERVRARERERDAKRLGAEREGYWKRRDRLKVEGLVRVGQKMENGKCWRERRGERAGGPRHREKGESGALPRRNKTGVGGKKRGGARRFLEGATDQGKWC